MTVVSGEILLCDFGPLEKTKAKITIMGALQKKTQKIMQFMDWADYSEK